VFVLDTNIVSELRRQRPHGGVVAWVESVPAASLFLAAVTLAEIQAGIETLRLRDQTRALELEAWADKIEQSFSILPADSAIFRLHARMMHGRSDAVYEDALIAATARIGGFTVATRNVDDFANLDVPVLNPFEYRTSKTRFADQ
jgi:predicted nucleic acid-binding protein